MNTCHTKDGAWTFDTASEAVSGTVDPASSSCNSSFLSHENFSFCPPLNPRVNTLAAQHRHKKRQQPLPEFAATHWQPTETRLTDSQKIIPSSLRGNTKMETTWKGRMMMFW